MSSLIISKKSPLSGEVFVSGSKNAALPIIFSTLIVRGDCILTNVPDISDVRVAIKILRDFGVCVERQGNSLLINSDKAQYKIPSKEDVTSLRASTYLLGAMLARFHRAPIMNYGGCNFDLRPIDMHITAALSLGATIDRDCLVGKELVGNEIHFDKISVGATVNSIIMAVCAQGKTRIYGAASEPHVESLIDFLNSAGADIKNRGDCLEIEGGALTSAKAEIIPDMIEAGTFLSLSLLLGADITVRGADPSHLISFFDCLASLGAVIEISDFGIRVSGEIDSYCEVVTRPYPGFPTDLQPVIAPLLAIGKGGRIIEGVWHNRFGYLRELSSFGLKYEIYNGYAEIYKSKIIPATAGVPDLRGGAALFMLALYADGESIINSAEILKRGYENIVNKLASLGADIKERNT